MPDATDITAVQATTENNLDFEISGDFYRLNIKQHKCRFFTGLSFRIAYLLLFASVCFLLIYPVNAGLFRLFLLMGIPVLFIAAPVLLWKRKILRFLPPAILALGILAFLFPGRSWSSEKLRNQYVSSLRSFEGTRYIWGGENCFGIDCSGLVRKGMINTHLREALLTANPAHLRAAIELWWYDCSARALKNGYRGWTQPLFESDSINAIDTARLLPGDMAVTSDGVHVLAYLGNGEWIEADPGLHKVFKGGVPVRNPWFDVPVSVLRWKRLE